MEILKVAVSKLKCKFSEFVRDKYIVENYGIKSCKDNILKPFENIKLELIFLSNLGYICINDKQLQKIKSGNYKNLFIRNSYLIKVKDIVLNIII